MSAPTMFVDESPNGARYFVGGELVSQDEYERLEKKLKDEAIAEFVGSRLIRRGDIALCSLGRLGLITNAQPQWVKYGDGYESYTFVGVYLESGDGYQIGNPWSSRNPRVVGHISSLLAESNINQTILCSGCGWCLDCLRVERSRVFDHLPEGSH